MTVKMVRQKEMSTEADMPMAQPNKPNSGIADHTHPEYDAGLVKIQELEQEIQALKQGGVHQEQGMPTQPSMPSAKPMMQKQSLAQGEPEDSKDKPKGKDAEVVEGNWDIKKVESMLRSIVREELRGVPERDTGKELETAPAVDGIPQSQQPPNGKSPSGGGFDSNDRKGMKDELKAPAPKSDYDKLAIKKNKMDEAKSLVEKAKQLMKEASEDPSEPQPGASQKKPDKMDGQEPNKNPTGGTEENLKKENSEDDKERNEKDEVKSATDYFDKKVEQMKKQITTEAHTRRQSMVGMSAVSSEQTQAAQAEHFSNKEAVTNTIKEYLRKAGHSGALAAVTAQSAY